MKQDQASHKLKRLERQLTASEKLLQTQSFTQKQGLFLQTLMRFLKWQTQWHLTGSHARLILSCQAALWAQETEQSQAGFIGPTLQRIHQGMARIMQLSLRTQEQEKLSLLVPGIEWISLGTFYLTAHLAHQWKQRLPQTEREEARKGHHLLRELSLTFVLGSQAIESALQALTQGLNLEKESQKQIEEIGMGFICVLLILLNTEQQIEEDHLFELLQQHLKPTLASVRQGVEQAQTEHLLDEAITTVVLSQLEVIHYLMEGRENRLDAVKHALQTILEAFELSYPQLEQDMNTIMMVCNQLSKNLNNIFYKQSKNINIITQQVA